MLLAQGTGNASLHAQIQDLTVARGKPDQVRMMMTWRLPTSMPAIRRASRLQAGDDGAPEPDNSVATTSTIDEPNLS